MISNVDVASRWSGFRGPSAFLEGTAPRTRRSSPGLYNDPTEHRSFEGFVVHMHLAWVYLLHAEFEREGIDYRNGRKVGRASRLDRSTAGQTAEASSGASTSGESIGSSRFEQTSISSSASSKVVYAWTWPTLPPTRTPADF